MAWHGENLSPGGLLQLYIVPSLQQMCGPDPGVAGIMPWHAISPGLEFLIGLVGTPTQMDTI